MKVTLLQLVSILGLTFLAGTAYNFYNLKRNRRNALEFLVEAGRYPNARDCSYRQKPTPTPAPPGPESLPDAGHEGTTVAGETPERQEGDPPFIGLEEAYQNWQDGFLFVDARRSREYEEGHIPGAVSIPVREVGLEERIQRLDDSGPNYAEPVVIYCTRSKDCEDSRELAEHLRAVGFSNLFVFLGGFPAWNDAHPDLVVNGTEPGRRQQ